MRRYFLGLGAGRKVGALKTLFAIGTRRDCSALEECLKNDYGGRAVLTKNGRSGLFLALKAYCKRGDGVLINGFTCFAVVEAVKAAGCVPIFADIDRETLNFNKKTLAQALNGRSATAIVVQNTLGIAVEIREIEEFAREHGLIIIEDLAHGMRMKYSDGREVGTVGAATALSFGKDKAIDTIAGGAVVFRDGGDRDRQIAAPRERCNMCDSLQARWYLTFAAWCRGLTYAHLGGVLMRALVKMHFVERSADSMLDARQQPAKWQAKLALSQLRNGTAGSVRREFALVQDRAACLDELKAAGYYFEGFWYEKPVSPERYYKKSGFIETDCPVATEVAKQIINIPTFYKKEDLRRAREIITRHRI